MLQRSGQVTTSHDTELSQVFISHGCCSQRVTPGQRHCACRHTADWDILKCYSNDTVSTTLKSTRYHIIIHWPVGLTKGPDIHSLVLRHFQAHGPLCVCVAFCFSMGIIRWGSECLMITGRGPVDPTDSSGPGTCMQQISGVVFTQIADLTECLDSGSLCVLLLYTFSLIGLLLL